MSCIYYIGNKEYTEEEFKIVLNNGLLDTLISREKIALPGFPIDNRLVAKTVKTTKTNKKVSAKKIKEVLQEEIGSRKGYPVNLQTLLMLNNAEDAFRVPLWLSPASDKFEPLLTSIVTNKVIKQKFHGKSYVLASQEGLKPIKIEEVGKVKDSKIIYTESYDPEKGLQPIRLSEDGKTLLPAQIMIPFKLRDEEGNIMKAEDFTIKKDGKTYIDYSAIPKELLTLFGFRIPSQGHNSMALVEIVGFVPEVMGDIVFAPRDFIAQMGSDFDVDKLYTYMRNYFYKDGKFHTNFLSDKKKIQEKIDELLLSLNDIYEELNLTTEQLNLLQQGIAKIKKQDDSLSEDLNNLLAPYEISKKQVIKKLKTTHYLLDLLEKSYDASLQNKLMDIKEAIFTNPKMANILTQTDGFGEFKDIANRLNKAQSTKQNVMLTPSYQRKKYINGTKGKSGTGTFSLDSTLNASLQGKDVVYINGIDSKQYKEIIKKGVDALLEENKPVSIFGNIVSKGDLSSPYTLASQKIIEAAKKANRKLTPQEESSLKYKSIIIRNLQSASVDNEKEQILYKINVNDGTFDAIRALALLGFEEEDIVGLINQPLVKKYLTQLEKGRSSLGKYNPNLEEEILADLTATYDPNKRLSSEAENVEFISSLENISGEELMNLIANKDSALNVKLKPGSSDTNLQQLLLLRKFRNLSEIGKKLKVVQSTINSDSKGVPANFILTSAKDDQVRSLEGLGIHNITSLLGEYEDGELVSPTTINGFATYYGTMFANRVFEDYFIYNTTAFKQIFKELGAHTQKEYKSLQAQEEAQKELFQAAKSYLFTSIPEFHDGNLQQTRQRLFSNMNNNMSLPSIIKKLKDHPNIKNNFFLKNLTLKPHTTEISRIFFETSTGENLDESQIYLAFLDLFRNDTTLLGTFNGIEYTPRQLGEDLIKFAMLEGGNQSVKQFVKYIPATYLLQTSLVNISNKSITPYLFGLDEKINTKRPSKFIRQFFQNNPSETLAFDVADTTVKASDKSGFKDVKQFELSEEGIKRLGKITETKDGPVINYPKFLHISSSKIAKKVALFEYDEELKKYIRIPVVKEDYDYAHYDFSSDIAIPVNYTEQVVVPKITDKKDSTILDDAYAVDNDTSEQIVNGVIINNQLQDIALLKDVTDQLKSLVDPRDPNKILLDKFENLNYNWTNTAFSFNFDSKSNDTGSYNKKTHTLSLNPQKIKSINSNPEYLTKVLSHEITHSFTSRLIEDYQENNGTNLTEEQKDIIKNLERLKALYYNSIVAKEGEAGLRNFKLKYENRNKGPEDKLTSISDISAEELSKYYGALKLAEFVTMALTDKSFQQELNKIKDPLTNTSVLESLLNFVLEFLNTLGFNVNKDSLLATAVKDSLRLVESSQATVKQTTPQVVDSNQIYNQLGSKTKSENVVIKSWRELKEATTVMTNEGVVATRIKNTEEHFGNPFSHDPAGKAQGLIKTETVKEAVENYINWIINSKNNFYTGKIKPEPNTIFVFGSNPEGRHGAGAAKIAKEQFGAIYGQGEGLQGNAYALPTKDLRVKENNGFKSISSEQIIQNIEKLYKVAKENPNKQFKIGYTNTIEKSLNGYTGLEMIEMFNQAGETPNNIVFSEEWKNTGKLLNSRAEWIREQLKSGNLKGKLIAYYKELGEPSHATALDYLINKYNWNNNVSQVVSDSLFKVKIDQFNYTYNPTTNEVIHNAKSGDKVETNDTQINKVLVQYALANNYKQRTFNGSTYVAIADRVLNIKNANEVSPETWEQAVSINTPVKETSTSANTKYELFPGVYANQGQTEALDKLEEFFKSDRKTFLLQGKGGTGKTTIIKKALEKVGGSVLVIAPTHKAKDVIEEQVKGITQNIKTLASALAIKLDENTGKFEPDTYARKMGNVPISKASIIVVDESSMVSDKLLEEIKTLMPSKAKIIFMGDKAQLPPVGQESDSKVFNISNGYELTEKMRQAKTSPIINIGTKVAANVESDDRVSNPITLEDRVDKYDDVSKSSIIWESSENKALDQFVEDVKKAEGNVNYAKVITFNNQSHNSPQSVKNLNKKIRNKLFGERASKEEYIVGEIVTAYDSFIADTGRDKDEILFNNSEDLIVTSTSFKPKQKFTITVHSQKDGTRKIEVEFDVNYLELQNRKGMDINHFVPVIAESSKNDYEQTLQKLFKTDRQLGYALSKKFANIQHGYAITSHKSQGSTYTNVYVMEDNIMGPSNGGSVKAKNQSLYVAVSRPTTKLVMVSTKNDNDYQEYETFTNYEKEDLISISDLFGYSQKIDENNSSIAYIRSEYSTFTEEQKQRINLDNLLQEWNEAASTVYSSVEDFMEDVKNCR